MEVSGEQKRNHINQKKRQSEKSPHSNMVVVCNLDDEQISPKDSGKKIKKEKYCESEGRRGENKMTHESNLQSCIDKLREELSCPICLEICYEPTITWCGHSFCRRCLELVLIKFDKCPKCRRFISKDGSDKVNIWNTIQLFFPQEVIAKRFAIFDEMAESVLGKNKHIRWEQE